VLIVKEVDLSSVRALVSRYYPSYVSNAIIRLF
jgi:hypothetical protein